MRKLEHEEEVYLKEGYKCTVHVGDTQINIEHWADPGSFWINLVKNEGDNLRMEHLDIFNGTISDYID